MFGGHGSSSMLEIARKLEKSPCRTQLIFLCGHNAEWRRSSGSFHLTMPAVIEEFTTRVDYFMSLADFFIGKAGPAASAKPYNSGFRSSWNATPDYASGAIQRNLADRATAGVVVSNFAEIAGAMERLLATSALAELRDNATRYENYAVSRSNDSRSGGGQQSASVLERGFGNRILRSNRQYRLGRPYLGFVLDALTSIRLSLNRDGRI